MFAALLLCSNALKKVSISASKVLIITLEIIKVPAVFVKLC